jgi:uncharacterized protein (TIGR02594 family)
MKELLLEILRHYGMQEVSGPKANPHILEFFAEIGYSWVKDDDTAWCSAALNYFCKKLDYERSGKLDARSWLNVGVEVTTPELGDVVIYWRNKKESWEGHVGLYISEENGLIWTLGGNQSNGLNISLYNKNKVLGYRKLNKL